MKYRNIAIIAHVDHGKTTLVDGMLRQSGMVAAHQRLQDRAMDRLDLERERGITIVSKNTAIIWQGTTINIVDTPGHSDFGGEVERVLSMVDSVLLLVDAFEGPMPQTRFVLRKSLSHGHRPVVVINKVDRSDARPDEVVDMVFDLFVALEAKDEQLDFPVIYASAKEGWAVTDLSDPRTDLTPLMEVIGRYVPPPEVVHDGPFQMQIATIDYNEFVGRIAVGRVARGAIRRNSGLVCVGLDGQLRPGKVSKLIGFRGLERADLPEVQAGDIIGLAGITEALPGETVCAAGSPDPLPATAVDEPTISMDLAINDGPLAGRSGRYVTSRHLRERLWREVQSNVALHVEETESPDVLRVSGRGELHLGILIETMRRESYELTVSMPKVITRDGPQGPEEPYEQVTVDCAEAYSGTVIQELNNRGGTVLDIRTNGEGMVRLDYHVPARGLIGYRSLFMTQTHGTGTLYKTFSHHGPQKNSLQRRANGVLVVLEAGQVTAHALETLQERGVLFVEPGDEVYPGQICGECSRPSDLVVNPCKVKKLDNMRSQFKEIDVRLDAPRRMSLEAALEYINADERVEVTPEAIRLRKRHLDHSVRRKMEKIEKTEKTAARGA